MTKTISFLMKRKINLEMPIILNISKNMIIRTSLIYSTSHLTIHNQEKGSTEQTKLNLIRKRIDGYVAIFDLSSFVGLSLAGMKNLLLPKYSWQLFGQ